MYCLDYLHRYLCLLLACSTFGCNSSASSGAFGTGPQGGPADFGATQGGIQDMSFAREVVEAGRVPPAEAFVVEAMFSEHDLPIDGEPCATLLCLRAATGIAPDVEGDTAAWLHVGMSSTIDPETFERPSLSVVAVVDVSGSMGWNYGSAGTPGALSQALLTEVAQRLDEGDRFSIVTYGSSSRVHLEPVSATETERIAGAISALDEGGSTNMEAGLTRAYQLAATEAGRADQVRLMLFTDVQPNVGSTTATQFEQLVLEGSANGVGLTVFAVGLGLNPDVLRGMSQIRNANAFSLTEPEQVPALMEDSWPWMVSPIAYDLALDVRPSDSLVVAEGYGFPESTIAGARLSVSTVFLSRRRGALLLRLAPEGATTAEGLTVDVSLEYETTEGELRRESFVKELASLEAESYEQHGVRKTVLLARLVEAMREAAESYGTDRDAAIAGLQLAHLQFEEALDQQSDSSLEPERELSARLLELMRRGASQDSFYGGF